MSPRAGSDRDAVVVAAVDLVNREGAGALSPKRLADELGVQTPSLYNHVDGLPVSNELTLLNARLLGDAPYGCCDRRAGPLPSPRSWTPTGEYIKGKPRALSTAVRLAALDAATPSAAETHRHGCRCRRQFIRADGRRRDPRRACPAQRRPRLPTLRAPAASASRWTWTGFRRLVAMVIAG